MADKTTPNQKYNDAIYPRRQMRDTVGGSVRIKNMGELYLPMPSSWHDIPNVSVNNLAKAISGYNPSFLPHNHPNPAYRAYLQRARFPDITANALRGMLGLATKVPPDQKIPQKIKYFEDEGVNFSGESLEEFFAYCVSEVLSAGNINIVVDFDSETKKWFMTSYTAESTIDWDYETIKGGLDLNYISFVENEDNFLDKEDDEREVKVFEFNENGLVSVSKYKGDREEEEALELSYMGKPFSKIPVFCAGSIENTPDPQPIPLLGISDIAIAIYQEVADLRNAHNLTCNPTLFIYGAKENEKPSVIGSNVVVAISNPQAKAEYPKTDTSALDHIREFIQEMYDEAASYGANLLTSGGKESGEALSIRQANRGANIVRVVKQVGKAIEDALKFISEMSGSGEVEFKPSTEFAEMILNAQDINALVMGWMQGAWDKDTVLDNMRSAGYIPHDKSNQEISNNITKEPPAL